VFTRLCNCTAQPLDHSTSNVVLGAGGTTAAVSIMLGFDLLRATKTTTGDAKLQSGMGTQICLFRKENAHPLQKLLSRLGTRTWSVSRASTPLAPPSSS